MAKISKDRFIAYVALLSNTLVWGLAIPIVKIGFNNGLTPTTFLIFRFILAALLSLPIIFFIRNTKPGINAFRKLPLIILLEFVGNVLALYLLYEGVNRTSAVESSLIASAWPIFAILGGIFILKEKEQKHELIGLLLAVAGTFMLVGRPLLTNHLQGSSLTGNLFVLGHDLITAGYVLLAKRLYKNLSLWAITHISFWVGSVSFISLALFQGNTVPSLIVGLVTTNPWPLIAIIYMAVFGSIIGLTLYLIGLNKIEASESSLFTYLQPAVAIPASVILLSETVQPIEIAAVCIVVLGVYLAQKR